MKGKITIPKQVRDKLGIKDDDYVTVTIWKTDLSKPSEKS
jgi:AbrB family looped-hinge helix DNA binding protein